MGLFTRSRWLSLLALTFLVMFTVSCTIGRTRFVPRVTRRAPPVVSQDQTGAGAIDSEQNIVTDEDDPLFFILRGTW